MDKFPHWADHVIAFIYSIAIPFYAGWKRRHGFSNLYFTSTEKKNIYVSGSLSLLVMAVVLIIVWLVFKRPLAELGLTKPANYQSWWWLAAIFVLVYIIKTTLDLTNKKSFDKMVDHWNNKVPFLPTQKNELPEYTLLCFSAGVFEEIIYRGYLVTYCLYLFGGMKNHELISIILPALAFSVAHYYQGFRAVIQIFILAIAFGFIYVNSGSLLIVMLLHFLIDLSGGLLTIKYMKAVPQFPEQDNFTDSN